MDVPTLFASNLQTFSNNAVTDLQYAGLTQDEALSREALQVAAGLFDMWDQHPKRLQDEDWTEEAAVMEAGQDLWTMWSLKEWAQEAPYNKFFSVAMVPERRSVALANINMTDTLEMPLFEEDNKDFETSLVQKSYSTSEGLGKRKAGRISGGANSGSGPSNARPTKISKTGSSQPSTKQAKAIVDISAAHATDKDSVDEGLEGDIAVRMRWNLAGDTARDAQCRARVVRKRAKRAAVPATRAARASDDDEEGPAAGPLHTTPALPTLGTEDDEGEVLGEGILGGPKLEEERDEGAPVAPAGSEGSGESASAKLVWRLTDAPATEFEWVTRRVGELRDLEAGIADYAATCERESAVLRFELLRLQTTLGETRRLQGVLIEVRRELEEALWEILAFE
ncbi:hypothetical protein C0991_003802 [Blastosporella zonata]|nr:hypothetical protein C0991_003802 [Blastosporella zonata]